MEQNNNKPKNGAPESKKPRGLGLTLLLTIGIVLAIILIYNFFTTSQLQKARKIPWLAAESASF